MPGDFRCDRCEYSCASCTTNSHTRLRVHWAPAIPHALSWAEGSCKTSGVSRRESFAHVLAFYACLKTVIASEAKQSILSLLPDGLLRCARNDDLKDLAGLFEN